MEAHHKQNNVQQARVLYPLAFENERKAFYSNGYACYHSSLGRTAATGSIGEQ